MKKAKELRLAEKKSYRSPGHLPSSHGTVSEGGGGGAGLFAVDRGSRVTLTIRHLSLSHTRTNCLSHSLSLTYNKKTVSRARAGRGLLSRCSRAAAMVASQQGLAQGLSGSDGDASVARAPHSGGGVVVRVDRDPGLRAGGRSSGQRMCGSRRTHRVLFASSTGASWLLGNARPCCRARSPTSCPQLTAGWLKLSDGEPQVGVLVGK